MLDPAFGSGTLAEGVQAWGDRLADVHRRHQQGPGGHVRGCRFGNLALEVATCEPELRDAVRGYLDRIAQQIAQHIDAAADRDELPPLDSTRAGETLVAHMEGLAVLAKVNNDPDVLRRLGQDCIRLLGLDTR